MENNILTIGRSFGLASREDVTSLEVGGAWILM